ncbi:MAG: Myxococcus cysteine-rich repeat-containing protein [Myxococcales bacterium]|nr:Myxococcus cysteine-rich repeat-containing protein [Myxococcales bacterium]
MRFRTLAIATALSTGIVSTGEAFVPHKGAEQPVVAVGRAPRAHRDVSFTNKVAGLATWHAQWDRDTDVPLRLWGPSIAAPRAMVDPKAAEAAAHEFLAAHLDLLAPGAAISDFVLVANQLGDADDVRTVAYEQRVHRLRVVGGGVGFSFKADHLIMVSSTALPNVVVRMPGGKLPAAMLETSAKSWLAQGGHDVTLRSRGDRVIIPVVRPRGNGAPDIEYRVAETLSVETTQTPGRWDVWLDAADASPIARASTLMFASGTVLYDAADRYPGATRAGRPATNANQSVDGAPVTSAMDGTVTWAGTANATIIPSLVGPLVAITNKSGALVTDMLTLPVGGTVTWSKATTELEDSQLSAFIFAGQAKEFVRTHLNPGLAYLTHQLSVNVNEPQTCNAYSTGDDIHFYKKNAQCENTGRMADVVYHEFGHSVHFNSIIPGQGQFDRAMSEGLADTLAVSITGDHGMGRGFFFTNAALRDLDPVGIEKHWPEDTTGEVHNDGEIIGETLYDLRKALEAKLGAAAGFARTLKVYYGIMQRSADIPSSYAEALVSDDDDGNLANGTPNECEITAAFTLHGLADPALTVGLVPPTRDNFTISLAVNPPSQASACPAPAVQAAVLTWSPVGGTGGDISLAAAGTTWSAQIPTQPDGTVVQYSVKVTLDNGSSITYPQNPADPAYQFYVGAVTKIACFDFEAGLGDWTHGGTPANRDEWQVGAPMGIANDPKSAHGGTNVLGIDLGSGDGLYMPQTMQWAESPEIDLQGHTQVRLQYYRWLNAEDGAYDQASILANGQSVWTNLASPGMPTVEVNHTDREWRFQDVDLSAQTATGKLKLKFALSSDQGLELGGWTIDDVCLVATDRPASATCGNGTVDTGETCDDGNTVDGDGCSATCQTEMGAGAGAGGGCCSAGTKPTGAIAVSLLTFGLVLRRRKRSAG